jgi:hypothetical protein
MGRELSPGKLIHTEPRADTSLEGDYQGREDWQAVVMEGTTKGWLLTPDQVFKHSFPLHDHGKF